MKQMTVDNQKWTLMFQEWWIMQPRCSCSIHACWHDWEQGKGSADQYTTALCMAGSQEEEYFTQESSGTTILSAENRSKAVIESCEQLHSNM